MATPIVSATAAMTLSLLGGSDGNYFKAAQVWETNGVGDQWWFRMHQGHILAIQKSGVREAFQSYLNYGE